MIRLNETMVYGWEAAIRGMRNPLNSWHLSNTKFHTTSAPEICENDLKLMKMLSKAGSDHAKFRRMICVTVDITAPLYWWKEFDTYKVGTVANSCSTMHKIHDKEFTLDDFSCEHLWGEREDRDVDEPIGILNIVIDALNFYRKEFLEYKEKDDWWPMIQLLPTSYNQKRTVLLNYEVLANIYKSRRHHKLDEWLDFCQWIKTLPYSEIITGEENEND